MNMAGDVLGDGRSGGGVDWFVVHTGQHYSHHMDRVFFEQLELPDARYNLDCGSGSGRHGVQTGRMLAGIEEIKICGEACGSG